MIYLITGVPGSGKTLYAVSEIERLLKEGRIVYTDIDGIDFDNENLFHLPPYVDGDISASYHDFRKLPDGSVVVYDEAQKRFPSTGKAGKTQFDCVSALDTSRHTGHDIYYITQEPTLIDATLRKFIYRHFHVEAKLGLNYATIYMKENGVLDYKDKSDRRNAITQTFKYPKHLFDNYHSAKIHTKKRRMIPKKVFFFLFLMGLLSYWGYSNYKDAKFLQNATGIIVGDGLSDTQLKLTKSESNHEYTEQIERKYDEHGFQYTSYFDNTLYMAIIGEMGKDLLVEIGQPPNAYQTTTFKLLQAGAQLEVINKCLFFMMYQGSKYRVTCPLHSRNYDYQADDSKESSTQSDLFNQLRSSE